MRDVEFPEFGGRLSGCRGARPATARHRHAVDRRISSKFTKTASALPKPRVAATQISLESDRSFASFDEALAHVNGGRSWPTAPTSSGTRCCSMCCSSTRSTPTTPRFRSARGSSVWPRAWSPRCASCRPAARFARMSFVGDPGRRAARSELASGRLAVRRAGILPHPRRHRPPAVSVLPGDPVPAVAPLVLVVTAFTVAHSFTLLASAYDLAPDALWFPPLIETLIAASIVYMALENIVGASSVQRRWMIAFGFGLVHGFGFSFALRETLQFAGSHLLTSLLSFNIGVELGQIAGAGAAGPAAAVAVPLRRRRAHGNDHPVRAGGAHGLALDDRSRRSAAAIRLGVAGAQRSPVASAMRWMMVALVLAGAVWLLSRFLNRKSAAAVESKNVLQETA